MRYSDRSHTEVPSEMVYWGQLPTITVFQCKTLGSFHTRRHVTYPPHEPSIGIKLPRPNVSSFSGLLSLAWHYGRYSLRICRSSGPSLALKRSTHIFASFPTLNGMSVFCFASVRASPSTRAVFTNIFGGGNGNEGLGILALSFDWQYITSTFMSSVIAERTRAKAYALTELCRSYPLIQQLNSWIGYTLCYAAVAGIYYGNVWNVSFPVCPIPWLLTHKRSNFSRRTSL